MVKSYKGLPLVGRGKFSFVYSDNNSLVKAINKKDVGTINFLRTINTSPVLHKHLPCYTQIDESEDYVFYSGKVYKPIGKDTCFGISTKYFIQIIKLYYKYRIRRQNIASSLYDDLDIVFSYLEDNKNKTYLDISQKNIMLDNKTIIFNDLIATRT